MRFLMPLSSFLSRAGSFGVWGMVGIINTGILHDSWASQHLWNLAELCTDCPEISPKPLRLFRVSAVRTAFAGEILGPPGKERELQTVVKVRRFRCFLHDSPKLISTHMSWTPVMGIPGKWNGLLSSAAQAKKGIPVGKSTACVMAERNEV